MLGSHSKCAFLVLAGLALVGVQPRECVASAFVYDSTGAWFFNTIDTGSSWSFRLGWAQSAMMNWIVGPVDINGTPLLPAGTAVGPVEPKFNTTTALPTGRVFNGLNYVAVPNLIGGNNAYALGSGSSTAGFTYSANWTLTASGLGTYRIRAVAKDPWDIYPADLAGVATTYDLYIPFALLGGQSLGTFGNTVSSFGADVTYETASGLETLLDIAVSGPNATVTPSAAFGSGLSFYLESGPDVTPSGSSIPGSLISAAALQSILNSDLGPDDTIDTPLYLGIVLSGLPIPTTLLDDGSIARIGVNSTAFEATDVPEVPEPPTIVLFGASAVGLALCACGRKTFGRRIRAAFRLPLRAVWHE